MIDRIHERAIFRRFGQDAERSRGGPLTVVRTTLPGARRPAVAFAISRKVGPAVVRNRLRRQLRVVCAELASSGELGVCAYLVVVRPEAAGSEMTTLRDFLSSALRRFGPIDTPILIATGDLSAPSGRKHR